MGIYLPEMKEGEGNGWKRERKRKRESHYANALTLCPPYPSPVHNSLTTGAGCLRLADHTIRRGRMFHGQTTLVTAARVYVIRCLSLTHSLSLSLSLSLCKTIGGLDEVYCVRALMLEQHLSRYGAGGLSVRVAMILHHRASASNDRVKTSSQEEPNSGWHHDWGWEIARCLTFEDSTDRVVPVGTVVGTWYAGTKNNNAGCQPWNGEWSKKAVTRPPGHVGCLLACPL
ncbi:hypothetical protein ASPBRDRAFT_54605 [Aspergillus brasiliensis CBS 101740]|uniref:Uncharacterized protein n=1 Tax=Aspergillus brasiliensis (strain CBS 101740 / IMI 381727 / IBT 21946) TaxID=767769 RepID=A0A1L9UMB3_ASPBC|nr:hypothetical protein ASPBRDRAFT_54605 [Aspergillus brasiliensis CBS 101740]